MSLNEQRPEANREITVCSSLLSIPEMARILIVCDDNSVTARLKAAFQELGLSPEVVRSMTAGCELARSGRFQVVFTTPTLRDGSWHRLADIANQFDLSFVVVLVASGYDFGQCAEAVKDGAFDVLDPMHELPKTAGTAKSALWAAYLKGAGACLEVVNRPMAA